MKIHTSQFKEGIKTFGREIDAKISYDETILGSEVLNYLKPSFNVELFKTIMKKVEFDSNVKVPVKSWVKPEFGIKTDDYEYLNYGNYYINEEPEYCVDTKSYVHKGYDRMIESMVYYDEDPLGIEYPISYKELIKSIATKLGWTFSQTNFPNENTMIEYDLYNDLGYIYRDILDDLCPASMGNFIVNDNGELFIKYPEETEDVIDAEFLKEDNIFIGKKVGAINSLVLSRADDSDTIYRKDEQSIKENGLNEIKIRDNLLLSSSFRGDFIDEMFDKIKGFEYQTIDVASTGIAYYEPLDRFTISHEGTNYSVVLFNSELNIEDGVSENLFSPELEESVTDYTTSALTDKEKKNASIIAYKNQAKIEMLTKSMYDFEKKVSGKNTIRIMDAVATYVDYFEVIANQLQANYNFFGRFFFGRIFSRKGYDSSRFLTVYVDTSPKDNPTENLKIYTYDLIESLRGYKGKNDRFVIENVQNENGQYSIKIRVYRNVELVDGILKILDEEIIQEIEGEVIKFNNGDNYLYVNDEYITNKMNVTFANNTELNKWYATKVELGSTFTITDEKITSEVSKKVGYDEIKSAINQSAEEIKIQAKDISLEGLVTANGYFKILEDGSFEAINGTFSGDIYLGDGKVISENGLMTNLQFRSGGRFYDYDLLGFNTSTETWANYYSDISLDVDIPSGFVITNAVLTLYHTPIWWWFDYQFEGWGSAKNLKLYKTNNPNRNHKFYYGFGTEYVTELSSSYLTEISGAFGTDSYTPSNTSDNTIETKSTINLKNYINSGNNKLIIRTAKSIPSMPASGTYDISVDTGMARAVLNITGYTKFNL